MMYSNCTAFCVFLFTCISCTPSRTAIIPEREVFDIPGVSGEIAEVEIGESLVAKGVRYTAEGILMQSNLVSGDGFWASRVTIPKQKLIAYQESDNRVFYVAKGMTDYLDNNGDAYVVGGIFEYKDGAIVHVRKAGSISTGPPEYRFGIWGKKAHLEGQFLRSVPEDFAIVKGPVVVIGQPNFKQELIYNGRIGNQVKMLYREFSGDYSRPNFSQEVQYDLTSSDTIGFKGLRVEVVDADNVSMRYRLIETFPDP